MPMAQRGSSRTAFSSSSRENSGEELRRGPLNPLPEKHRLLPTSRASVKTPALLRELQRASLHSQSAVCASRSASCSLKRAACCPRSAAWNAKMSRCNGTISLSCSCCPTTTRSRPPMRSMAMGKRSSMGTSSGSRGPESALASGFGDTFSAAATAAGLTVLDVSEDMEAIEADPARRARAATGAQADGGFFGVLEAAAISCKGNVGTDVEVNWQKG
mmetsp:Transcript_54182/g.118679  ORF Transcript_54182/g.118679 Transcript_54182/m.118679 type:complete len:217 (+) Transcript_54182:1402-2052(+)